jgi:Na+:H+ antiporter, NhaA family
MSNIRALRTSAPLSSVGQVTAKTSRGLPDLWHFAAEYLLGLPFGVVVALAWANLAPESYFRTVFALDFFVTDVAMVFFFGLVMKEVVEATAPGGVLHTWRRAGVPVVTALGLTVVPAIVFAGLAPLFGEPMVRQAWPVTFATDLAFGYFVAILIFGRHPVVPFFLLLALSANAFGFVVLAPAAASFPVQHMTLLILMAAAIGAAAILRHRKTTTVWPYIVIGGGLSWCALLFGGIHPALALVPIVPFLPHAARDPGFFVDAPPHAHDTLNEFERWCRHPAQVALVLFGFITGGVPLRALDWGVLSMPLAILIGKPLGLLLGIGCARAFGLRLPYHVGWRHLIVVAFISTIGFTMALFFATVAIGPGAVLSEIRMGALLTLTGGLAALAAARWLQVGRFSDRDERRYER